MRQGFHPETRVEQRRRALRRSSEEGEGLEMGSKHLAGEGSRNNRDDVRDHRQGSFCREYEEGQSHNLREAQPSGLDDD